MKATIWEFKNRALVFGLIFGLSFFLYSFDPQNLSGVLADWLSSKLHANAYLIAHFLLSFAALLVTAAAGIRTWASSYLWAGVVYASEVKTASLVADGPYRHVRNPLYFANVLMAIGTGAMMSRTGFLLCTFAMVAFCYRLILREEAELASNQGERYTQYRRAVPRLWPSWQPRIAASGSSPKWADGFRAESWYWGLAAAVASFAVTLNLKVFFVALGVSIAWFWLSSSVLRKK